jgi:hypothetical protein
LLEQNGRIRRHATRTRKIRLGEKCARRCRSPVWRRHQTLPNHGLDPFALLGSLDGASGEILVPQPDSNFSDPHWDGIGKTMMEVRQRPRAAPHSPPVGQDRADARTSPIRIAAASSSTSKIGLHATARLAQHERDINYIQS